MMNLSQLLTSIKMDLGIYGLALPFEKGDQAIVEAIQLRTLTTFSQYAPYVLRVNMELSELICIQNNYEESIYEIPDVFGDRKLLYIRKIDQRNKMLGTNYGGPNFDSSFDTYNALMLGQANADLYQAAQPAFSFKFQHPNLLHLFNTNSFSTQLVMEFAMQHTDNLATIPNTSWESFYDLASLDVKKFLFNALKHYRDIQTAYGTITLKIDDWEGADNERKELIEKWRDLYHLDTDQFIVM